MVTKLDQEGWVGNHADNLRAVKARLLQLNPNYNVFIWWSPYGGENRGKYDMVDSYVGSFKSAESSSMWSISYTYDYVVFQTGNVGWYGSRSDDRICYTDDKLRVDNNMWYFSKRG